MTLPSKREFVRPLSARDEGTRYMECDRRVVTVREMVVGEWRNSEKGGASGKSADVKLGLAKIIQSNIIACTMTVSLS